MCTATWLSHAEGYSLFFNRDELRRRKPAAPPTVRNSGGMQWIAPTDGDSGGTWIAANAYGVTVFLLNGYAPADLAEPASGWTSRGALVESLADTRSTAEIASRLREQRLDEFRSFWLASLEPSGHGMIGKWIDGTLALDTLDRSAMPLVSSSFDTDTVRRTRIARFVAGVPEHARVDDHLAFHTSHDPEAGPYSVCMHRQDAQTVSFSRVTVDRQTVRFHYAPHAPHEGLPTAPAATLPRRFQ